MECYLRLAVSGVRSEEVTQKIALHLSRFQDFFRESYGHDRLSTVLRRDVVAWQKQLLSQGLAHATINNHLASLSSFTTWVYTHNADLFPVGDPAKGIGELGLPPLEPPARPIPCGLEAPRVAMPARAYHGARSPCHTAL